MSLLRFSQTQCIYVLKGSLGYLISHPCLEFQGCRFIPFLLSPLCLLSNPVLFLIMTHSPDFSPQKYLEYVSLRNRLFFVRPLLSRIEMTVGMWYTQQAAHKAVGIATVHLYSILLYFCQLYFCLSVCLSACCVSVHCIYVCLSVSLSLPVRLSVCLSIPVSLCLCVTVCVSVPKLYIYGLIKGVQTPTLCCERSFFLLVVDIIQN